MEEAKVLVVLKGGTGYYSRARVLRRTLNLIGIRPRNLTLVKGSEETFIVKVWTFNSGSIQVINSPTLFVSAAKIIHEIVLVCGLTAP